MSPLSAAQLAQRAGKIGSSTISSVLGLNPFAGPIDAYLELIGEAAPKEETIAMNMGNRMEPVIAQAYADIHSVQIRKGETTDHPSIPWAVATPDYHVDPTKFLLECKNVGARMVHHWGPEGTDQVPQYVLVQAEWQAMVIDPPGVVVAALLGGSDLRFYELHRDRELEGMMMEVAERFMREHVIPRRPPRPDGSESYRRYLADKFPAEREPLKSATSEDEKLAKELAECRNHLEHFEKRKVELENQLKCGIGDAAGIKGEGWSVTWKASKGSRKLDYDALLGDLRPDPELVAKHTSDRPGSRRFLFTAKGV